MSDLWNKSEPPRDRAVVIIGNIVFSDNERGYSLPVLCRAQWSEPDQEWLHVHDGLSIRQSSGEMLKIHFWVDLPTDSRTDAPGTTDQSAFELQPQAPVQSSLNAPVGSEGTSFEPQQKAELCLEDLGAVGAKQFQAAEQLLAAKTHLLLGPCKGLEGEEVHHPCPRVVDTTEGGK